MKKYDKSKFSSWALLFKHFLEINIQFNMSEQEKKRQRIYDFLNAETKQKFLCLPYIKQRKKNLLKKSFLRKRGSEGLNKKQKEGFLTGLATVIKKDPTTSFGKSDCIYLLGSDESFGWETEAKIIPWMKPLEKSVPQFR